MSAEGEAIAALTGDPTVAASVQARVFYHVAPQGTKLPFIVYERSSSQPFTTIHDSKPFATNVTLSLSAWARAADVAKALGDAAIAAMHDAGPPINRFSHYDETIDLHASVIDFDLWELETS